jgi:hypothetical protein
VLDNGKSKTEIESLETIPRAKVKGDDFTVPAAFTHFQKLCHLIYTRDSWYEIRFKL